jgi:hypothetical protein
MTDKAAVDSSQTHDIPAHTWVLALAVFLVFGFLFLEKQIRDTAFASAIGEANISKEVNALREEVKGLRETLESIKAAKASAAPASNQAESASPSNAVSQTAAPKPQAPQPKPKAHR